MVERDIITSRMMRILPGALALLLLGAGCQSASEPTSAPLVQPVSQAVPAALVGTSWAAESIDGRRVLERAPSTVTFGEGQRLSGQAACNRYFGTYELGEGALRLKPAGATRMACEPAVMDQETRFLQALETVTAFRHEAGALLLVDATGRLRVRLVPARPGSEPRGQPPPAPVPPVLSASAFDCPGGPGFVMIQPRDVGRGEAIDLSLPSGRRRLSRVPTASGARYEDTGVSVWNKGREATLELDGRTYTCIENRRRSLLEDARARGVEFRAAGQEPGWLFELFPDRMAFSGNYGTTPATTPRPAPRASLAAGETVYAAVTERHRLTVRIRETRCLDTMSGEPYESTVEVEIDGAVYRGCGEALH
jgi:putative lipoprotein